MPPPAPSRVAAALALSLALAGCKTARIKQTSYQDANMDFASVRSVAVLPFANLSRESSAGERVKEVFSNMLLATGATYVLPPGEVARAINRLSLQDPRYPSVEEVTKLGGLLKADAVIRGVVKEYGEVRSGTAMANVISVSLEMYETGTGKIVWSATSTKGGIGFSERLLGGGGAPMDEITETVVDDLLNKLFR